MNELDHILEVHRRERERSAVVADVAIIVTTLLVVGVLYACGVIS